MPIPARPERQQTAPSHNARPVRRPASVRAPPRFASAGICLIKVLDLHAMRRGAGYMLDNRDDIVYERIECQRNAGSIALVRCHQSRERQTRTRTVVDLKRSSGRYESRGASVAPYS